MTYEVMDTPRKPSLKWDMRCVITHRAKLLAMRVHVPGKQFYIPVPERFQKEE